MVATTALARAEEVRTCADLIVEQAARLPLTAGLPCREEDFRIRLHRHVEHIADECEQYASELEGVA